MVYARRDSLDQAALALSNYRKVEQAGDLGRHRSRSPPIALWRAAVSGCLWARGRVRAESAASEPMSHASIRPTPHASPRRT